VLVDRSVDESCTILDDYGVPNALILDLAQVNGHPRTQALNMVHSVNHVVWPLPSPTGYRWMFAA